MDREALIILAEMLDKARHQANAIDVTAPQSYVYGDIAETLKEVLALITDGPVSAQVYDALLDGSTVREALVKLGLT